MDTIYVYSTPSYCEKHWYKIGFTSRDAATRVKEQDGTSNPEALQLLIEWPSQGRHDSDFHAFLEKKGIYQIRDKREWFQVPGGLPVIRTLWNDFVFGISRPNSYPMRPEQRECCEQAVNAFRGGNTKFLINAKPRFGKTFTTYQIIKKMGYKNVLILSYKPQVFDSWRGDLENHVDFHNWSGSKATDGMPDSETNIVFESFQQLLSKNGLKKNPKTKWIYGHKWDLVVLDEEHYGTKTENAGKVFSALKRGYKLLKLSGTPYKTILNGEFNEEQIFNWTYVDEQKCKNSGSPHHQNMPTMRFNTFKVHPDIVEMAEELGYVEEDGFRIEKVFAAQAEGFENPNLVSKFLDTFSSQSRKGQSWSPLYAKKGIDPKMLDHMLWVMPQSVDSVRAICEMLNNHKGFESYHVINASGSDGVSDIQVVKKAIRRHNKTITVTCGRFDTGVTVPEWKSVVMLDGSKSPEKYIQTIFRVQNPLDGYSECVVIDFNPQRLLEMTYDWCAVASKKSQSTIDAIKEFFEVASIIEHGENGIIEKDLNGVMSAFNASGGWRDRFASRVGLRVRLADPKVLTGLLGIKIANARKITEIVSDSEMEEGKISKTLTKAQEKKRKDEIKKIAEQAKQVLRRIPTYLVSETRDLADTSQMIDEGNVNTFKVITDVEMDWFEHSLDIGFLDRSHIDRCISDLGHSLGQINYKTFLAGGTIVYQTLSKFERANHEETPFVPIELVNRMFEEIPDDFWSNPRKKIVDPSCSTGVFLLEAVRRFNIGLKDVIPEEKQRLRHILTRQIYGAEPSMAPFLVANGMFYRLFVKTGIVDSLNIYHGNVLDDKIVKRRLNMKFDVCIQNPPYQMRHSAERQTGISIYPDFVRWGAKNSNVTIALTPSRWFKQKDMLDYKDWITSKEQGLRCIWHTDDDTIFGNGVSVKGGVSFVVLDNQYSGPTYVSFISDYVDLTKNNARILITRNQTAESIIEKVKSDKSLADLFVSSGSFKIRSNDSRLLTEPTETSVKCYVSKLKGFEQHVEKDQVETNKHFMSWKLVIRSADGKGNDYTRYSFIAAPGEVLSESYCFFPFESKLEALNCQSYLETNFHSFLMKLRKSTQRISKPVFEFIPLLDFSKSWTDFQLAQKFGLTEEEVAYINEQVG